MAKKALYKKDILYPGLSYQIIGVLFDVFNELGYGYREKIYQRAICERLKELKIVFQEEARFPLNFKGKKIGWQTADFLIDDKIILELKRGIRITRRDIEQVVSYLEASKMKLGILARFSYNEIIHHRVLNPDNINS